MVNKFTLSAFLSVDYCLWEFSIDRTETLGMVTFNDHYIGSEHLLLGLLRGEGTVAGSILASNGLVSTPFDGRLRLSDVCVSPASVVRRSVTLGR
jgi:hypothetical protein